MRRLLTPTLLLALAAGCSSTIDPGNPDSEESGGSAGTSMGKSGSGNAGTGFVSLATSAIWDRGVMAAVEVIDPNGERTYGLQDSKNGKDLDETGEVHGKSVAEMGDASSKRG